MLHINLQRSVVASFLAVALATLLAGCGGGGGHAEAELAPTALPPSDERATMADGFAYAQSMVNAGQTESEEPQAVNQIELSSSDSDEPDPRI